MLAIATLDESPYIKVVLCGDLGIDMDWTLLVLAPLPYKVALNPYAQFHVNCFGLKTIL